MGNPFNEKPTKKVKKICSNRRKDKNCAKNNKPLVYSRDNP